MSLALWSRRADAQQPVAAPDSSATHPSASPVALPPVRVSTGRVTTTISPGETDLPASVLRQTPNGPSAAARILSGVPGVSTSDDQGTRTQPTLDLRGFELSPVVGAPQGVSVFLDGVRFNEPDAQQVNFDLVPLEALSSVQVVRGPRAVFGKNSLGGAVLLATRRGEPGQPLTATASVGSFGLRQLSLATQDSGALADYFISVNGSHEDGYRVATPAQTRRAFLSLGRSRGSSDLALTLLAAHDRISEAGSLPESWLAVDRRLNYTIGDFYAPTLLQGSLRGERQIGSATLRGNVFDRRNRSEQFNVNVDAPSTRAFVDARSAGFAGELALPLSSRTDGALTLGTELSRSHIGYRVTAEPTPDAPTMPDDCDASGECERARVVESDATAFVHLQLPLTVATRLTLAARGDWVRLPFEDLRAPQNDGTSTFWRLSPRAALAWSPEGPWSASLSWGTGFRAPAALELACADESAPCSLPFALGDDPPLHPVVVRELDASGAWAHAGARARASLWRADTRNEIVFAASSNTAGFFRNIPLTRRQGLDLDATLPLGRGLSASAQYGYVDATYRSTVLLASAAQDADSARPGDRFPLTPRHRIGVALSSVTLVGSWLVQGRVSANGTSSEFLRGDESNTHQPLPGHATMDASVGVARGHYEVSLDVTNLLGARYQTFGVYGENPLGDPGGPRPSQPRTERFLTPGYPRAITISLRVAP